MLQPIEHNNFEKTEYSPLGKLLAVAGFINKNSSYDETCLERLSNGRGFDCSFRYVSGCGIGSKSS